LLSIYRGRVGKGELRLDVRGKIIPSNITGQQQQPRIKFQLAVVLKSTQQLIGNCGIRMEAADAHEGDIGYELSPQHWGNGYATEAARTIVEFGFTQLRLHRIWSWCIAENSASANVLQKVGMQAEGRKRENEYFKGRWWDTLLFGMLDYEWKSHQQVKDTGAAEESTR
jgi:ribosomal-protein-alanine N-acetyltransferase